MINHFWIVEKIICQGHDFNWHGMLHDLPLLRMWDTKLFEELDVNSESLRLELQTSLEHKICPLAASVIPFIKEMTHGNSTHS